MQITYENDEGRTVSRRTSFLKIMQGVGSKDYSLEFTPFPTRAIVQIKVKKFEISDDNDSPSRPGLHPRYAEILSTAKNDVEYRILKHLLNNGEIKPSQLKNRLQDIKGGADEVGRNLLAMLEDGRLVLTSQYELAFPDGNDWKDGRPPREK